MVAARAINGLICSLEQESGGDPICRARGSAKIWPPVDLLIVVINTGCFSDTTESQRFIIDYCSDCWSVRLNCNGWLNN